jgi:hypothetical protein
MTTVKLVKFKIKEGKQQTWLDWAEELKNRKTEVITTLKDEGVSSETNFMSKDGSIIYYLMESDDFEKVKNVANASEHSIDIEHRQKKESVLSL